MQGEGGIQRVDRSGALYWLHFHGGASPSDASESHEPPSPKHEYERADADTLHGVYSSLLGKLKLSPGHTLSLQKRGYLPSEIRDIGFRSLPSKSDLNKILNALAKEFPARSLLQVPGFFGEHVEGSTEPKLRMVCYEGYLLPQRDQEGRIVGLQVRLDSGNPKYLPFSSTNYTGCGGAQLVHIPHGVQTSTDYVVLAEGFHKAELVSRRLGALALGLPSASAMRLATEAVEASGKKKVMIALDADARSNMGVGAALIHGANYYAERDYDVQLATWTIDAGKGLDDVIQASKQDEVKYLSGKEAWATIVDLARASKAVTPKAVEARIKLMGIVDRVIADRSVATRPETIDALSELDEETPECAALVDAIKDAATGIKTAFNAKLKEARKNKKTAKKLEKAEARGQIILKMGDDNELAEVVQESMATEARVWDEQARKHITGKVSPLYTEGSYWIYRGKKGLWEKLDLHRVELQVHKLAGALLHTGKPLPMSASKVKGTLNMLQTKLTKPNAFAHAKPGLAFKNGFVHVVDGKLVLSGHHYIHGARFAYPFDFVEGGEPKRFLALLERYFRNHKDKQQRIACIQEFMGAVLIGQATKGEKVLLLYGQSGNDGKSSLVRICREAMPTGSTCALPPQQFGDRFRLDVIAGAMLNVVDELPRARIVGAENFKIAVTAKNPMTGEKKGKDPYDFLPSAGHLLAGNYMPTAEDWTGGWFRRFIVLVFDDPLDPEKEVIKDIEGDILKEELAQIISWFLAGAVRFLQQGMNYTIPESSTAAVDEWRLDADPVKSWVATKCQTLPLDSKASDLATRESLYTDYVLYAEQTGHKKMSINEFANRLSAYRKHTEYGNRYRLILKEDLISEEIMKAVDEYRSN